MRDIQAAYKQALVEEYEGYRRVGRAEDAEHVAAVLRDRFGHEVAPETPERTDVERPPENTAAPKPARQAKPRTTRKPPAGS